MTALTAGASPNVGRWENDTPLTADRFNAVGQALLNRASAGGSGPKFEILPKFPLQDFYQQYKTFNHSLGKPPVDIFNIWICAVPEGGYAVGDRLLIDTTDYSYEMSATQVKVMINHTRAQHYTKNFGAYSSPTHLFTFTTANWEIETVLIGT